MALKVKAVERVLKFDKEKEGKYRYVLKPDLYTSRLATRNLGAGSVLGTVPSTNNKERREL